MKSMTNIKKLFITKQLYFSILRMYTKFCLNHALGKKFMIFNILPSISLLKKNSLNKKCAL